MKFCKKCSTEKPSEEFYVRPKTRDGLHYICKECEKARTKKYTPSKEATERANKKWRDKNKEKIKESVKEWRKRNPAGALLSSVKTRAKRQGLEFNIDTSDINIPEVCPILRIPLRSGTSGKSGYQPDIASVDRLDPTKGYIKGNVWVISMQANLMKNHATLEECALLGEWASKQLESKNDLREDSIFN